MKNLYLSIVIILIAGLNTAAQSIYLQPAPSFSAMDLLQEQINFSSFDLYGDQLFANDGASVFRFSIDTLEQLQEYPMPADYIAWAGFLNLSPDGKTIWAGYTVSDNTDDRIYTIDVASGEWKNTATLPGNSDLIFVDGHILVSGLENSSWESPTSIFLLDTTGANAHRKIIEIGGSMAGLAADSNGNIYYATYFFSENNFLYQWNATDIESVINNPDAPYLTVTNAVTLSGLPSGAYDCHVDEGDNVIFNINDFSSAKILAIWDKTTGSGFNYDTLALANDDMDWLSYIKSRGDIMVAEEGNEIFALSWSRPIAKVFSMRAPVVEDPIEPLMAAVADELYLIDLDSVFSHPGNVYNFTYSITNNSFSDVAIAKIDVNELSIEFLAPGQTNITIEAISHEMTVLHTFIVGVQPTIDGDYVISDFEDLPLEAESFWNGSDGSGGFESGIAYCPNTHDPEWGVWSGWSYSNISDNTTPGWLNQYSAITAAGVDTIESGGANYAIAYSPAALLFSDSSSHQLKGMYITNTTYAALSMKHGDDFTKKFGGSDGNDPDWFKLSCHGMVDGVKTETIEFYLADFRFEDNSKDYIIETWQWLELSSLGKVDSLTFSLSSTDMGDWGMNTPGYFAIDNVYIVPEYTTTADIQATDIQIYPNPSQGRFHLTSPANNPVSVIEIYNLTGQRIYASENIGALQTIDLGSITPGTYLIRIVQGKELIHSIIVIN